MIFRGVFRGGLSERKKIQSGVWCSGHHKQHVHLQSLAASRPLTTANSYKDKELVSQNFLCLQSALDKIMPHRIKRVNSTHRIYGAATPGEGG